MFLPGIGGHLKVSHMDPRVSFGNESTNLSVQKSFLPFYIKSSHPSTNTLILKLKIVIFIPFPLPPITVTDYGGEELHDTLVVSKNSFEVHF